MRHESVIDQFGGVKPLAQALAQNERAVRGWKERKRIPPKHWLVIVKAAQARGLQISFEKLASQ